MPRTSHSNFLYRASFRCWSSRGAWQHPPLMIFSLHRKRYSGYRVKLTMKNLMTIGGLAKATGVKIVTIRYYERVGLLPTPSRTEGNYRAYKAEHVRRLEFIRRLRALGFTLDQ